MIGLILIWAAATFLAVIAIMLVSPIFFAIAFIAVRPRTSR
jgi:hypothetical protein